MKEKICKLGIKREQGFLYYLNGTDVWKTPMKRAGGPPAAGKATRVAEGDFEREDGFLYFVDKDGDVARSKRAVGGQKRKKKVAAAKKTIKRPVAKKPVAKAVKKPVAKAVKKPAAKTVKKPVAKKPVGKAKKR